LEARHLYCSSELVCQIEERELGQDPPEKEVRVVLISWNYPYSVVILFFSLSWRT